MCNGFRQNSCAARLRLEEAVLVSTFKKCFRASGVSTTKYKCSFIFKTSLVRAHDCYGQSWKNKVIADVVILPVRRCALVPKFIQFAATSLLHSRLTLLSVTE